jgi:DNA invertase Pin-like site-specific DNA recombinase
MLSDVRQGELNRVLVYKSDRLTRSVKDFHVLMDAFERYNVQFVSVTHSIDTGTPAGRLMRSILLDFAQFEREMTADRTRDKMRQRAEKGMWNGGIPPYGYRSRDKKLVPDDTEAPRVRFMFQHFAEIGSLATLRKELARRG